MHDAAWDGSEVRVGVSVGIARFPDHALPVDALLAAADGALYRARREGRSRYIWATALLDSASDGAWRMKSVSGKSTRSMPSLPRC